MKEKIKNVVRKVLESNKNYALKITTYLLIICSILNSVALLLRYIKPWESAIEDDEFYDADSARTLGYFTAPETSLSFIRPGLWILALFGHTASSLFSPYVIWLCVSVIIFTSYVFSIYQKTRNFNLKLEKVIPILTLINFSSISFLLVPESFLISCCMYWFSLMVFVKSKKLSYLIASAYLAYFTNIFLLLPWTIIFFLNNGIQRKTLKFCLSTILPLSIQFTLLFLIRRFVPNLDEKTTASAEGDVTFVSGIRNSNSESHDSLSFLQSLEFTKWFHSPFDDFLKNVFTFLAVPWTVPYNYFNEISFSNSIFVGCLVLISTVFTIMAWSGIRRLRAINREFANSLIALEISCFLLFLVYGQHSFLFSPMLITSRIIGFSFSRNCSEKWKFVNLLSVSTLTSVTFSTIL